MNDDVAVNTVNEISDDFEHYKFVLKYYSDGTTIEYWEQNYDTKMMEKKESFNISANIDLKLFKTAYQFLSSIKDRLDME